MVRGFHPHANVRLTLACLPWLMSGAARDELPATGALGEPIGAPKPQGQIEAEVFGKLGNILPPVLRLMFL